ncbi:MAG: hydrogenase maturation protease [Candidatus Aminicenantes bacterium]|nr:MAG: hydrogenase maturation protease [Candidatus Aminicenantes bacterium]
MKILVLGLGNELYGDEAVGIHVIRKLREDFEKPEEAAEWLENVELEECSLSGLALLEVIVDYDTLVIIDSIKKEKPVTGKIHLLEKKDLRHLPGSSPHSVSFPQSLELGKKLGLNVPSKIKIIAVEAKNQYNLGEGLTEEMTKAMPVIVEEVKKVLQELA